MREVWYFIQERRIGQDDSQMSSIITWEDIYKYIKATQPTTKRNLLKHFEKTSSNINKKLHGLKSHKLIKVEGDFIYAK